MSLKRLNDGITSRLPVLFAIQATCICDI